MAGGEEGNVGKRQCFLEAIKPWREIHTVAVD